MRFVRSRLVRIAGAMALATGSILASSRTAAADSPVKVPKETLVRDLHVVALEPVSLPEDLAGGGDIRVRFAKLFTTEIEALGIKVLSPDEYEKVWREHAKALGGVYDRATGKADEQKMKTCREYTDREMERRFSASAIASIEIVRGVIAVGPSLRGTHLHLVLRDPQESVLYDSHAEIEWSEIYINRAHEPRDRPELATEKDNLTAVRMVLRDLYAAYGRWPGVAPGDAAAQAAGQSPASPVPQARQTAQPPPSSGPPAIDAH